jgi:hypothetical protein
LPDLLVLGLLTINEAALETLNSDGIFVNYANGKSLVGSKILVLSDELFCFFLSFIYSSPLGLSTPTLSVFLFVNTDFYVLVFFASVDPNSKLFLIPDSRGATGCFITLSSYFRSDIF